MPVPNPSTLYPDLTLAIHPIRTPPTPHNIPIHPLSRRYQTSDLAQDSPPQLQRIENMSSYIKNQETKPSTTHELYSPRSQSETRAPVVNGVTDDTIHDTNHTKDEAQSNLAVPRTTQSIKSATEKLKWKFLGW